MHLTTVKLKDGRIFSAPIFTYYPEHGWMRLIGIEEKLYYKDMISAVTEDPRPGEMADEIQRARIYLEDCRRHCWYGMEPNSPKQEWE